jgi:hypothetical protein
MTFIQMLTTQNPFVYIALEQEYSSMHDHEANTRKKENQRVLPK